MTTPRAKTSCFVVFVAASPMAQLLDLKSGVEFRRCDFDEFEDPIASRPSLELQDPPPELLDDDFELLDDNFELLDDGFELLDDDGCELLDGDAKDLSEPPDDVLFGALLGGRCLPEKVRSIVFVPGDEKLVPGDEELVPGEQLSLEGVVRFAVVATARLDPE
jgi:hypothetical protein